MTGLGVEVTDLTLQYGDTTALDRLSVALPPGKIHGLVGRDGSGTVRVGGEDPFENERIVRRICRSG